MSLADTLEADPFALAERLRAILSRVLGVPLSVGVAVTGPDALGHALRAAGRATESVASWPCPYASLTHSGSVAIAVALPAGARADGLGVDLELDRTLKRGLARLICDPREQAWIEDLPEALQATELLRLWTAKEALYKADPAQGDAIVAEYALASPNASSTFGGRAGEDKPAKVVSIRIDDATISVAYRAMENAA
ncbi:MAG TPA: 4'-phosphopantetheinyl transferase superfamily protein [Kofleriaceae bacterium]|nr:4'-phosphopantetheinyl transferase superfamily protein [Kofleriaceae bacterium]